VLLRTYQRVTKSIKYLFSLVKHERSPVVTGRHTDWVLRVAFICFALFILNSFIALPSIMTWLLRIIAFASFGVLLMLISQQTTREETPQPSKHPLPATTTLATKAEKELACSRIEIRKLATRLNTIHEEERARMAREVHDVLGQNLTVLKFGLERMATDLGGATGQLTHAANDAANDALGSQLGNKVNKLILVVDQTFEHVQRLSTQFRPCMLDELGLTPAIEWLVCEFTWQTEFTVELNLPDQPPPIDDNLATVLYRIVQEALTNVVRHAKASQVKIALQITAEKAILLIQDNGCGFDTNRQQAKKSMGLIGMRERIVAWDGIVRIDSTIGQGTTIYVEALLSPP